MVVLVSSTPIQHQVASMFLDILNYFLSEIITCGFFSLMEFVVVTKESGSDRYTKIWAHSTVR